MSKMQDYEKDIKRWKSRKNFFDEFIGDGLIITHREDFIIKISVVFLIDCW